MTKPCAVFWDIENIDVPKGQSVASIVNQIRSTIIKPYNLTEIFFFCVCDVHRLSANVGQSLKNLDVDIVQAYNGVKDSADIKILDLMRKFVAVAGQDCTIILLSGDADYCGTLSDLKKLHNVSIHVVRLANSCSPKLDQIADYTFMLNNGVIKSIKSTGLPMYFISVKNYPASINVRQVMNELNAQAIGSSRNSAILYDNLICIGFPTLWNAERAIKQFNGSRYHGHFLKAELISDSPLTEIIKCLKPNMIVLTKKNKEVKQLTFIKMNNSNDVDNSKIIKFCIACATKLGSQCILSRKPYLWIVYSFKSDAQDCLPKVQIMYPDAIISEPPIDLTLKCHENPYTVESCQLKVKKETGSDSRADNSNIAIVKPERAMQVNKQEPSSSIGRVADIRMGSNIEPKVSKESRPVSGEPKNIVNSDVRCDNERKMFFKCVFSSVSHVIERQSTKWSLLYNLFEKLYDLGAKKVIFDGNLYCAHFDSASAYRETFEKMHLLEPLLEPLEFENVSKTRENEVTKKIDAYITEIPWCFNQELDLCCLTAKIGSNLHDEFIETSKSILGNHECIFIKSVPGEIWIGYPDELICENSKKTLLKLLANLPQTSVSMAKPSKQLLELINFYDLAGDAYDLAFLSRLLGGSDSIDRPDIIERISLQRMEEKECNELLYCVTVEGNFHNQMGWDPVCLSQIVKIFVKLSKVIPLAATASYEKVNLIFNSWHEAHAARHFIKKLTTDEVPYFKELRGTSIVQQQKFSWYNYFDYYIINDQRKVLEKIIQNKNPVNKLDLNSSTVQSKSGIDLLDGEVAQKLKYFFTVTTAFGNYGFKPTSGMISIITMPLVQMDCPVFIKFQDTIWFGVDDYQKGAKVAHRLCYLEFKMLHEDDKDDFYVETVIKYVTDIPTTVYEMLADKLINPTKTLATNAYANAVPLGHFNYNYRKAVGMSISRYCQLNELVG